MINVYLISSETNGSKIYKIGITRRKVTERLKEFRTGNASILTIENVYTSPYGSKIESYFHGMYKSKNVGGEWFNLNQNDIDNFITNCKKIDDNFNFLEKNKTFL
jgi:hypothetical protein